jgi:hypothetical protein
VIAVLLAALGVASSGLDVAVDERADPDVRPGGRDRKTADAGKVLRVTQRPAVRAGVREVLTGTPAPDARADVRDVAEAGASGRLDWVERSVGNGRLDCC